MENETNLKLAEIDRGLLVEQVDEYLAQCIADIADVNKEPTKKRTVQITITFQPSRSRREAAVSYQVSLKPSTHIERESSTIYLGKAEDGTPIAKPWVPNQQTLPGVDDALNLGEDSN